MPGPGVGGAPFGFGTPVAFCEEQGHPRGVFLPPFLPQTSPNNRENTLSTDTYLIERKGRAITRLYP